MKKLCNVVIKFKTKSQLRLIEKVLKRLGYISYEDWNKSLRTYFNANYVVIKKDTELGFYYVVFNNIDYKYYDKVYGESCFNGLNDFIYDYYGLRYKEFFIEYMESFVDGQLVICKVCDLENTFCEGSKCEKSYDTYMSELEFNFVRKDLSKDFDFRNKYNNMSIRNKVGLKRFLK